MSTNTRTTQERIAPNHNRPETCSCWNTDADLACFECHKAGFETQNPTISED